MEIFLTVIIVALIVAVIILLARKPTPPPDNSNQLSDISRRIDEMTRTVNDNNLRGAETMTKDKEISQKLIKDITDRLARFETTNRSILNATDKLEDLQNILLNPKHRGNFGEFQLNSVLENFFPPNQWREQYKFKNGDAVDAVLFLSDKKILPIDSKFSLENYQRLMNEKNPAKKSEFAKLVKNDLKKRIDETSKYIRPSENTMDFAFMFIPSEALYYDALVSNVGDINSRDLIEYAYRDKKVIIVSPTTFVAYLQTVLQGLRGIQINDQAKEIQKRVAELGNHIKSYDTYMNKLGNSLSTTVNQFNTAHRELKKIDRDVVKITGGDEQIADTLALERPKTED
jgi:DNA recombination protein RmuC